MTILGLSESAFRFSLFAGIFLLMAVLEAWLPRRERRFPRSKRWFTNIGVLLSTYAAIFAVTFVIPVTAVLAAMTAETNGWGLFNLIDWPIWLEWTLGFVLLDRAASGLWGGRNQSVRIDRH